MISFSSLKYVTKNNILTDETTWLLNVDGISLHSSKNEVIASFSFKDIAQIHLQYAPTRYVDNRYTCKLVLEDGRTFWFSNHYFNGVLNFVEHSKEYSAFVRQLALNSAANNSNCKFIIGSGRIGYFLNVVVLIFTAIMLIVAFQLIMALGLTWMIVIKLAVIATLMPRAIRWIKRNKYQTFLPQQIPNELLP